MSARTPGPWGFQGGNAMNGYPVLLIYGQDGKSVGHVLTAADAMLASSAPDLLEALVKARRELELMCHSYGYDITHLPMMDAAIKKATGA
jgi:hypothetical protein